MASICTDKACQRGGWMMRKIGLIVAIVAASIALFSAAWAHRNNWLPYEYIWWAPAFSVMTLVMYSIDKAAARHSWRRIPEIHLHLLSLVGGWPGALIAQQLLRHKTRKQPFQTLFWLTVVVNLGLVWWLVTSL